MPRFRSYHQVSIDEWLDNQKPLFDDEPLPLKRCRIDFCDALLVEGDQVCEQGHHQYEKTSSGAARVVFPGAIDARGSVVSAPVPDEQRIVPMVGRKRL